MDPLLITRGLKAGAHDVSTCEDLAEWTTDLATGDCPGRLAGSLSEQGPSKRGTDKKKRRLNKRHGVVNLHKAAEQGNAHAF